MRFRVLLIFVLFALGSAQADSDVVPKADLQPTPTWAAHQPSMREAVRLHDEGEYDRAIEIYRDVLAQNSDDILALYELSYSLSAKQDHAGCRDTARSGARYRSAYLGTFRMVLGNCLDALGNVDGAIEAYIAAIHELPDHFLVRYNLAVTLTRAKRLEEARDQLRAAITLNPAHPGSHAVMSDILFRTDQRIPALLASLRFLALEPTGPRSVTVLDRVRTLLAGRIQQEEGNAGLKITIGASTDEGDFSAAELVLDIRAAAEALPASEARQESESAVSDAVERIQSVIDSAREANAAPTDLAFAARHYLPYFVATSDTGQLETLVNFSFLASGDEEPSLWVEQNRDRVKDFLAWSERYDGWQGVVITNDAP